MKTFDWTSLSPLPRGDTRRVLEGRYAMGRALGSGGQGSVYEGEDLLSGEEIAIKVLPALSRAASDRVNLEITALRWLRVPGVVQLRDDGVIDDMIFLVMDRVRGLPFPAGPMPWSWVKGVALRLLETLDAVHAAGVLHRDIKPSNILMGAGGNPILIDFGLARGDALVLSEERRRSGTFQYCSPEQLRGAECDPRSDLYSLGVVLYEVLTGALPYGYDHREIMRRHQQGLPPRPPQGASMEATAVLTALLALDPAKRPESAAAVIELLGGLASDRRVQRLCDPLPEQATEEQLRRLFCGPDLFLHLREDAATALFERTEGWRSEVVHELGRWLRQGQAHYRDGLVELPRVAIDRLREPAPPLVLGPDEALELLEGQIRAHLRDGEHSLALGQLDRAVGVARRFKRTARHRTLLELWAEAALFLQDEPALDRCLCELGRGAAAGVEVEDLGRLVRGFWCAVRGEPRRSAELLDGLDPFESEVLTLAAHAARVIPVLGRPDGEEALSSLDALGWGGDPGRRGRLLSWRGVHAYRRGDFEAALHNHRQALELEASPRRRMAGLLNVADAALELGALEECRRAAQEALIAASALRAARSEAGAFRILRAAAYRGGEELKPDRAAVSAAESLGPWRVLGIALTEAAIAWRTGRRDEGLLLALRGRAAASVVGMDDAVDLLQALALACGHPPFPGWRDRASIPTVWAEARALRAVVEGPVPSEILARVRVACAGTGWQRSGHRGDVLSCAEVIQACTTGSL